MLTVIISFALGVCGWCTAKLLFEPIQAIIALRSEILAAILVHTLKQGEGLKDSDRQQIRDAYLKLSSQLVATHYNTYPWVRYAYSRWLKWDIHSMGDVLGGAAHSLGLLSCEPADFKSAKDGQAIVDDVQLVFQIFALPDLRMSAWRSALNDALLKGVRRRDSAARVAD
jgi:hypothetical protein